MNVLDKIQAPVSEEVARFHDEIGKLLLSRSEWLAEVVGWLSTSTGKMVRPIMTSLMAGMLQGSVPSKTIDSAILLELIHTATLIHDDVIDEAKTRRGRPTLGAIYDNRVAVLMGDFVLASALVGAIKTADLRIVGIISSLGRDLTEGEIRQFETASKHLLSEETYMDVIRQKTAVLFRGCAEVAAITTGQTDEEIERLGRCGELIGLAFQIRDDVFDYYKDDVGKPTGHDIEEGKITLPLLYALLKDGGRTPEGTEALTLVERGAPFATGEIELLLSFAKDRGGVDYAQRRIEELLSEAVGILAPYPESVYKESLMELIGFVGRRTI